MTLTPEPDEGYEVDEVMVTGRNGDEIELTDHGCIDRIGTYDEYLEAQAGI